MSALAILEAGLVVAQQEHGPPPGAHLVLLAGAAVAILAILGVKWWRGRRDSAASEREATQDDRPAESTQSTEEQ